MSSIPNKLPSEVKAIVLANIDKANATINNKEMVILTKIWKEYVEPDVNYRCPPCIERILKNWKALRSELSE